MVIIKKLIYLIRSSIALIALTLMVGCGDSAKVSNEMAEMFSHKSLSMEQYADLANIPKSAQSNRLESFNIFEARSSIADNLLKSEFKGDLKITRQLVEAKSRIVLDAYFDSFMKGALSEEVVQEYYDNNKQAFSENEYRLSYYLVRVMKGENEEIPLSEMHKLYLNIKSGQEIQLGAYEANIVKGKIVLSSNNADPTVLNVLEGISEGGVAPPVRTKLGVQVFKVEAINTNLLPINQVRSKIEYRLKEQLIDREYRRLLSEISN